MTNENPAPSARPDLENWDPNEMLRSLTEERDARGEDEVSAAERILKESLPLATQAIVHTAMYSANDKLRLDAAKYVVERNLGGLATVIPKTGSSDPFAELLADVVSDIEEENVERASMVLSSLKVEASRSDSPAQLAQEEDNAEGF